MLLQTLKQTPPMYSHLWAIIHVVLFIQQSGKFYQTALSASGDVKTEKLMGVFWPPVTAIDREREERLRQEVKAYVESGPLKVTPIQTRRRKWS